MQKLRALEGNRNVEVLGPNLLENVEGSEQKAFVQMSLVRAKESLLTTKLLCDIVPDPGGICGY